MRLRKGLSMLPIVFVVAAVSATADTSAPTQQVQQSQAASRLQVTGTRSQFSLEADHADVQSVLKALFTQAGKQFDVDNSVGGTLTLKLESQPLDVVLTSLCRQAFAKYHQDTGTGIYHFEQDIQAIKAAIGRINSLNALLREQLRALNLDVPSESQLEGSVALQAGLGANAQGNRLAGTSVPGGRSARGAAGLEDRTDKLTQSRAAAGPPAGQIAQNGVSAKAPSSIANSPAAGYKTEAINTDNVPDYLVEQLLQAYGLDSAQKPALSLEKTYANYLKQNNLVAINTKGVAVPVSDVLAELRKQSGVPILLDPSVPVGQKFRITLSLPACTLPEALNLILPPARLRWRTLNSSILVSPTPEFQVFFGSTPQPYVIYGNSLGRSQQNGGQGGVQAPAPGQ